MKILYSALLVFAIARAGVAAVEGKVEEKLGVNWEMSSFKTWVEKDNALITPEVANLTTQYCLRTTQAKLDEIAYDKLAVPLVDALKTAVAKSTTLSGKGLKSLAELLHRIQTLPIRQGAGPKEYIAACNKLVQAELVTRTNDLKAIYQGRLTPRMAENAPPELKAKLQELEKRGIKVAPLTFPGLQKQICLLEGYYSLSHDPRLWKLFSTTRAMANVLPAAARGEGSFWMNFGPTRPS